MRSVSSADHVRLDQKQQQQQQFKREKKKEKEHVGHVQ